MKYSQMLKINSKFHWLVQKKIGILLINKKNILAKFVEPIEMLKVSTIDIFSFKYDYLRLLQSRPNFPKSETSNGGSVEQNRFREE